ncbi:LCP family protein [Nocardioides sp. GY 10127]|uniref:LCP family protein n=1 Tax=Nocardioides sp. GY 10127 TaxID=2569762 RepID=UPI0010A92FE2|nr:LCP family protein [Nocardioides sp. GY 10127]TIC81863.1 LytR family transcriptional regulator [Nocardioides sp. GY 10127]
MAHPSAAPAASQPGRTPTDDDAGLAGIGLAGDGDGPGDGGQGGDHGDDGRGGGGRRRRRTRTVLLVVLVVLALGVGGVAWSVHSTEQQLDSQVTKVDDVFSNLENRPSKVTEGEAAGAVNILLLGSDLRSDTPTTGTDGTSGGTTSAEDWVPGSQRSDTMMLLHLSADRKSAALISFPRDSWVDIPGYGKSKINAAFSWGGPSLAVETVEQLTGVYVDHVAWVDWDGFAALTDELGGVDVWVPGTVYDSARDVTWTRGMHHLDGEEALLYVRQRYGLAGGDLDRVRRQQYFMKALMDTFRHQFKATDPLHVRDMISTLTEHLSVSSELTVDDLKDLLMDLTDLKTKDVDFMTAPVAGFGYEGDQSVVYLDHAEDKGLFKAVRRDEVRTWSRNHVDALTIGVVS